VQALALRVLLLWVLVGLPRVPLAEQVQVLHPRVQLPAEAQVPFAPGGVRCWERA